LIFIVNQGNLVKEMQNHIEGEANRMNILVIGGTKFLGRCVVQEALSRGHQVTLLNRGNHNEIFAETSVEMLIGDRNSDLEILQGRTWDAVVDTCAFLPEQVTKLTKLLQGKTKHYTFISSISVYQDWVPVGIDESYDTPTLSAEKLQEVMNDSTVSLPGPYYGPFKRMCEVEAERHLPGQVLSIRAGLLVGPYDYTDRLTYWVRRVHQGGSVLTSENPHQKVQFIDARDVARWILHAMEYQVTGIYNATGPEYPLTFEQLLETCQRVTKSDATWVWTPERFLLDQKVAPWTDLPLWLPEKYPLEGGEPWRGGGSVNCKKAFAAGLSCRPLEDTLRDLWQWDQDRNEASLKAGLSTEREQEILRMLKEV
jgi:2'-hydroxyisoflavone reductase